MVLWVLCLGIFFLMVFVFLVVVLVSCRCLLVVCGLFIMCSIGDWCDCCWYWGGLGWLVLGC